MQEMLFNQYSYWQFLKEIIFKQNCVTPFTVSKGCPDQILFVFHFLVLFKNAFFANEVSVQL